MSLNNEQFLKISENPSRGEVNTNVILVRDMLDQLPESLFISDKTTFLDPCFGTGTFLKEIAKRLFKYGHSKENIESRLFGVEKSIIYYKKLKQLKGFNPTLIKADFLKHNFENMKFDVVIGNPPYNGVKKTNKLWPAFIEVSHGLLKDKGALLFLTPQVWVERDGLKIKRGTKILYNNQILLLDLTISKYFQNIGETICFWYLEKSAVNKPTPIKDLDGVKYEVINGPLQRFKGIKYSITQKLLNKYPKSYTMKKNSIEDIDHNTNIKEWIKKGIVSEIKTDYFNTLLKYTASQDYYINDSLITMGWRVGINLSGYYYKEEEKNKYMPILNNVGTTNGMWGILCSSEDEAINIRSIFSSKLYRYVNDINKTSGFNTLSTKFPVLDRTKQWTDQEIYNHFNLTQDEIQLIEDTIK